MKRLKALPWYWRVFVIVILLCLLEYWGILGNWHTIVLVAFTMAYVLLIYKSISDTHKSRREDRELDFNLRQRELDFNLRQLDWIVNWAREVRKELLIRRFLESSIVDRYGLEEALQNYAVENEEIIIAAKNLGAEFERIVDKAAKDLWAYIEALKGPTHQTIDYNYYIIGLSRSFSNVLKSALKVESDLVSTRIKPHPGGTGTKRKGGASQEM